MGILDKKYDFCLKEARKLNPSIILMCDSNDIITLPFFFRVIDAYQEGYDFYSIAGSDKHISSYLLNLITQECYNWNGIYPHQSRWKEKPNCAGGIKGWSDRFLAKVDKIETKEGDEGLMYLQAQKMGMKILHLIPSRDGFEFWNLKVDCEIHDLKTYLPHLHKTVSSTPRKIMDDFMKYYEML